MVMQLGGSLGRSWHREDGSPGRASSLMQMLAAQQARPAAAAVPAAAAPAVQQPGPVGAPVDPYAAIRNLNFRWQEEVAPTSFDSEAGGIGGTPAGWTFDFDTLKPAGFQSKYNAIVPQADGSLHVVMQQPGRHKYDTMIAAYTQDPATGQWTLANDPMQAQTRQRGSGLSAKVEDILLDLGVSPRIAAGLSNGPGSSAALAINDIAQGLRSIGLDGGDVFSRLNREVLRNSEADIYDNARATSRAAAIASVAGGGAGLASAFGGGAAGGAASGALLGGATQAEGSGEDIARGALTGALIGGARGYMQGSNPSVSTGPSGGGDISGGGLAGGGFNDPTSYQGLVQGATPSGGLPSMLDVASGAVGYGPVSLGEFAGGVTFENAALGTLPEAAPQQSATPVDAPTASPPDPYGPGSGYGQDTLSNMGVPNDTAPGFLDSLRGGASGVQDWIRQNPQQARALVTVLGGVMGGAEGGGGSGGGSGTPPTYGPPQAWSSGLTMGGGQRVGRPQPRQPVIDYTLPNTGGLSMGAGRFLGRGG
jgi:hypothetical protein